MKRIFTILLAVLLTAGVFAQSPEKMSYQAVIRNSSNTLLTNTAVGMKISIIQGSAGGTPVYVETQTPTTNANGLVSIEIGNGIIQSGNFSNIDWSNGTYFIKTETDPTGGNTYTITGTSQLLSVPYALHAKTTETLSGSGVHYLGEEYLGGIIFYLYNGNDGQQHGLIVSKTETTATWQNSGTTTNANRSWDGSFNTNLMSNSPAKDWVMSNFSTEWYLPSIDELVLFWHNRFHINKALNDLGFTLLSNTANYWSSTEYSASFAFYPYFGGGNTTYSNSKLSTYSVRAVRAF